MHDETVQHLWELRKANEAFIEGLKVAIFALKIIEDLSPERRKSMIESLNGLVSQSEIIYGEAPTKH